MDTSLEFTVFIHCNVARFQILCNTMQNKYITNINMRKHSKCTQHCAHTSASLKEIPTFNKKYYSLTYAMLHLCMTVTLQYMATEHFILDNNNTVFI